MNDRNKPGESIHHSSFTTHNSLVPRLRFPEFRDAGEWVNESMGELYGFHPTNTFSRDKLNYTKGDVRNIHYGDIHTKFATLFDVTNELVPFINGTESVERIRPESYCIAGDVIFADASEDMEDVGKSIEIVNTNNEKIVSGLHTILARQLANRLAIRFGGYLFKSGAIRKQIKKEAQGAKVLGISSGRLSRIKVCYPSDREEQQKIADCLSSLDALIAAQADKIDALKTHKKGLMQQLFPREGETTPRLRFPEFRDAGGWRVRPLGEIAEIKLGKMLDKNKHRSGHLLPYLNNLAVRWNDFDTSDLPKMYFDSDELEKYELATGDVVVCEGGEPGRSAVWDGRLPDMKFQKALHRVRFQIQLVPHMLVHYLETIAGTEAFEALFTGGGIKHLTRQTFANLSIPIASPAEQECIADCLSSLDALIAAHTEKLEALKAHKKGLIQQLFPSPEAVGV